MNKTLAAWMGIVVLPVMLSGQASASRLLPSSADRINAAFPVAPEVQTGKAAVLELATGAQRREFETQFDAHLERRAHNCANDYSPSVFTSIEEIRNHLNNSTCFDNADREIIAWLGIRRVGVILAQPPLVPIPASKPSAITANANIFGIPVVADKASVALLFMSSDIGLVDLNTSKLLFREPRSGTPGPLSPNGRLFITGEREQLKIRDTLTGKVITEISGVLPWEFHWLDERTAFYVNRKFKSFFIDFTSGETIATGIPILVVSKTVRLPDAPDQYAVMTGNKLYQYQLVRGKEMPKLKLLAEKALNVTGVATNTTGVMADGTYFFGANNHLTLVNLRTLESEEISLDPFQIQTGFPTPDPDKIVITGFVRPQNGSTSQDYIYSISKRTLAQIKPDRQSSVQRLANISSLGKFGRIENNKIELTGDVETAEVIPLANFIQNANEISAQNKVAIAERQVARINSCRPSNEKNRDGIEMYAIGIYEGPIHRGKDPSANKVDVLVYKSDQPIVLALLNYEPVVWNIKLDKGAKVSEIILSASDDTRLMGIRDKSIKISRQKFGYAYEDCKFFQTVAPKLKELNGLNVTSFQGAYRGTGFPVRPSYASSAPSTDRKPHATKTIPGLDEGLAAYEKGDYRTALDKLAPLSRMGVPMAQNTLGKMYMQGKGLPQDHRKALLLFRKAAEKNLPNAQNNLGVMYAAGYGVKQNFKVAIYWLKKAANQNYVVAINNLADLYKKGVAVSSDPIETEKWQNKSRELAPAKDMGNVEAKLAGSDDYEKAQILYYGSRYTEALPLYLSAAKQGNLEAQLKLASMYKYAQGVKKNEQLAKFWAKKAAAHGYSDNDGRDRIYLIDPSSEEGKKFRPTPEPRIMLRSTPSPASTCACPAGMPVEQCCPDKKSAAHSMAIKPP
jgi:TPR repeat protein